MRTSVFVPCAAAVACASLAGIASAQFQTGFESYNQGTVVGQDGWYQPVVDSNDFFVAPYFDAVFNVGCHPEGGSQVLVGTSLNSVNGFARSQRPVDWSQGNVYTLCLDFWADCPDPAVTTSNIGSFSVQPFGATPYTCQGLNTLLYYNTDGDPASQYSIAWNLHNSDGSDIGGFWGPDDVQGVWPGGPWSNLVLRNWYRCSYVIDFNSGQLLKLGIKNLRTGEGHVYITVGGANGFSDDGNWYIAGGANNILALPRPTEVRAFAGGQGNGNVMAFDNVNISVGDNLCVEDSPALCPADFNLDGFIDPLDYNGFINAFEAGSMCADFNNDGFLDPLDYNGFINAFEAGC